MGDGSEAELGDETRLATLCRVEQWRSGYLLVGRGEVGPYQSYNQRNLCVKTKHQPHTRSYNSILTPVPGLGGLRLTYNGTAEASHSGVFALLMPEWRIRERESRAYRPASYESMKIELIL